MIKHIFKIIWNERRHNVWLIFEYIVVFCVLWLCCDYLYIIARSYYGPSGFDIEHTYKISMYEKPMAEIDVPEIDKYALAVTFMDRVKRYPGVEYVSFSNAAIPYGRNMWMGGHQINSDSVNHTLLLKYVTSDFFDVFKVKIDGRKFDWLDNESKNEVVITPLGNGLFGQVDDDRLKPYPILDVKKLRYDYPWDANRYEVNVVGIAEKMKGSYNQPYISTAIMPLKREDINLSYNEIAIRVSPDADKDFPAKFTKDMREQLYIGPYYLGSVVSIKNLREAETKSEWGAGKSINSTVAITSFLMVNVFLGLLGSFWFRTQSRRSEIGLRIALGSSKKKVKGLIIGETLLLLSIASIIATILCLSFGSVDLIKSIGIPAVPKLVWGIGYEQNFINFAIVFSFLAIVSILAVWYPARQAAVVAPAEALRDE